MEPETTATERQLKLGTKVLVVWMVIAITYGGYRLANFPAWMPVVALFASRLWLWPAFPRVARVAWRVFWIAQICVLFPIFDPTPSATTALLWAMITFGMFAFVLISDAVLVYRDMRIANEGRHATAR